MRTALSGWNGLFTTVVDTVTLAAKGLARSIRCWYSSMMSHLRILLLHGGYCAHGAWSCLPSLLQATLKHAELVDPTTGRAVKWPDQSLCWYSSSLDPCGILRVK